MKKIIIRHSLNYNELVTEAQRFERPNVGLSLTVPNEALTVRQIMNRFAVEGEVMGGKNVYYDGTEDFDQVDQTLDPAFDLADYSRASNEIAAKRKQSKKTSKVVEVADTATKTQASDTKQGQGA